MKRYMAEVLGRLGMLPLAYELRIRLAPYYPRVVVRNVRFRSERESRLSIPSARARYLVCGTADIGWFLELGQQARGCIEDVISRNGFDVRSFRQILDFGCGCGRVLRHWTNMNGIALHGTDQNELLVAECRRSVGFADVQANSLEKPLNYEDESFDLVYAISVFTHLSANLQEFWRNELRRVLKPGGLLLFTTHGARYLWRLNRPEQHAFREGNVVVQRPEFPGKNLCIAYHPERYVREKLARGFEILEFAPESAKGNPNQDIYLMARRD
jgi:SAM-dependent methyltransferase